ncbi:hypothetical protein AGOR_G00220390 [Albula goreensis]|uniref:Uncharacterized protein n=1 Tax=Albula goreensis TaxID=1534307 RepID=A0A8T3CM09_9TELE|nr:hypothetical protein AGOR_G00220390 [Albula goreensis]
MKKEPSLITGRFLVLTSVRRAHYDETVSSSAQCCVRLEGKRWLNKLLGIKNCFTRIILCSVNGQGLGESALRRARPATMFLRCHLSIPASWSHLSCSSSSSSCSPS